MRSHGWGITGDRRVRRIWALYGFLFLCVVGYTITQLVRPHGQSWPWLDDWGVAIFEIFVAGLCLLRAAIRKDGRNMVALLGLGLLAWAIGDLVLAIESSGGATPPTPSIADWFYLSFYPLTYVALVLLVRRQLPKLTFATWLDGAVAGVGAAALCAAFAFRHVLGSPGDGAAAVAVNLAYPVGDVLLLALVVTASTVLPGRRKAQWLLMAMGYMINALGDTSNLFHTGLGSSRIGTLLDAVAWPTSILLVSGSVWLRSARTTPAAQEEAAGFLLPGLASVGALAILLLNALHESSIVAVVLAFLTLLMAGVRAALSLVSLREVTAERHRQAFTDQLTGLSNRRELSELLSRFFAINRNGGDAENRLAFLYVDLNGFKEVNDSFGHLAGDEVLRQLGGRLKGALRTQDLLARLGGDEFGVVLVDADAEGAATVAQRLSAKLEQPFMLESLRARIGASIGIALAPTDAASPEELLRCADVAMYRAKQSGKGFAIYQHDLDGGGNRMRLVEELDEAIANREFELHYQPQVDLASGEIVAVEALIRWPHPRLGYVPPLEFLPLAEEAGLMGPLTALVLEDSISQCAEWRAAGQNVTVSVNISASSLLDTEFTGLVAELLNRYELPPSALVLEVTETTAIADLERSKIAIDELRDLAITVSVDDFGAGFTSLAYLSSLAVGELKLDRSFITGLSTADGGRDLALVRSTIELAHSLGLRVVAEGVEDNEALELLSELGCDLAQGYVISRPKPPEELTLRPRLRVLPPPTPVSDAGPVDGARPATA